MDQAQLVEYVAEKIGSDDCFRIIAYIERVGFDKVIEDIKAEQKRNKPEAS